MPNKFSLKLFLLFLCLALIPSKNISADIDNHNANPVSYDYSLQDIDTRITALEKRVDSRPNEWLIRERLISTAYEKALLTNNINDYQRVERELNAAIALAPKGSGPLMLAARFNYSIHRLDRAEEYLAQIKKRPVLKTMEALYVLTMSSEIAFNRGEYSKALEGYRMCETLAPGTCIRQLIIYYSKTGGYTEADALLKTALAQTSESDFRGRAWLNLQSGILAMERGQYEDARKYLHQADRAFPNWWLAREHIAEVYTLMNEDNGAQFLYEDIVSKTNLPQYMDALAAVYKRQGKEKEAAALIEKAASLWEEQLKIFPESASGHALDHFLDYNGDNKKILTLAENNFKTRPNAESKIYLAKAYLKNDQLKLAQEQIDSALESSYKSADLFDTAREIYSRLGDKVKSQSFKAACLRINPSFK